MIKTFGYFYIFISILFNFSNALVIDLSGEEILPVEPRASVDNVLGLRWFEKVEISGFASAGYVQTGNSGDQKAGHFIQSANIFIDAKAWEDKFIHIDYPLSAGYNSSTGPGGSVYLETYILFKNLLKKYKDDLLNMKIGRMDMPFGEEYLQRNPSDNSMISMTVAYPWASDEALEFYGNLGSLGWIAAVMDGPTSHTTVDHSKKSYVCKIYGTYDHMIYASLSALSGAKARTPDFWLGSVHTKSSGSVTTGGVVTINLSQTDALEADLKFMSDRGYIAANFGIVSLKDMVQTSKSRNFSYFMIEPLFNLNSKLYLVGRYSQIEVKSNESYAFGHMNFGVAATANKQSYAAFGMGYKFDPNNLIKLEYGKDIVKYKPSTGPTNWENPYFMGIELSAKF